MVETNLEAVFAGPHAETSSKISPGTIRIMMTVKWESEIQDRICLITGATSGIGRATAAGLASQGGRVIVVGRSREKTAAVVESIKAETGNQTVEYLTADFADLQQVRGLAAAFKSRYPHLDVLVNNAGAFYFTRKETPYGVEMTLLVNHLAPFLLTNLLFNTNRNGAPARIVNVSSDAHQYAELDFANLGLRRGFNGFKAYARSKLANLLFTYELARRLRGTNVAVNALHPGLVATNIWKMDFPIIGPAIRWLLGRFVLSPEQGAANSIFLASSPEARGVSGKYFVKCKAVRSAPISYDEGVARQLWDISADLTGLNGGQGLIDPC